jgi:preprotein translocase subunit SecD
MLHFSRIYTLAILGICLLGLLLPIPNFLSKSTYDSLPSWAQHRIGLGLDLRGGAHLLASMDMDELKKDWLQKIVDQARQKLREAKLPYSGLGQSGGAVQVRLTKPEDMDAALKGLRSIVQAAGGESLALGGSPDIAVTSDQAANSITLTPTEAGMNERAGQAVATAVEIIRNRLDPGGIKEVAVQRQGRDRILVQAPGVESAAEVANLKELINKSAKLTYHLLHPTMSAQDVELGGGKVPSGYELLPSDERQGDRYASTKYLVDKRSLLTGEDLADAQPGFDSNTNEPVVNFRFNQRGAKIFGKVSTENVGKPFAMVLDGKVISAPVIREPILGGTGQISGNFSVKDANNLAILLRSGALPAKLTIVEERVVGASLGQDAIDAGKRAAIIGMIGVAAFMIFAYGLFGVFAVIGAAMHVVFVIAIMTFLGSTMTLPGIAGVVLTIGMAVDANVLIYERIREELRNKKTPIAAIDAGFARAYATIIDSQLTTFIAGLLMFWLGSGPIRGFAVTLTLGILTTVFTAFTITRLLTSWWLAAQKTRKIEAPL